MTKTFSLTRGEPLLDIASLARGGPRATSNLTPSQIEHIRLTVNRAPEVVVKVLPRSSNDLRAVGRHLDYISRQGGLEIESDDGERLRGQSAATLLEDWDLDIDQLRRQGGLTASGRRSPPKIVHKIVFSMPPGTSPQSLQQAVRNFAREEFWGKHRYAMALHTDEPHPHVHVIVKAISEHGERFNIRKSTLQTWRKKFAANLRAVGVSANATERAVRGETRGAQKDGIYRASRRGASSHARAQVSKVASELQRGVLRPEPGKAKVERTHLQVLDAWREVANRLERSGDVHLAAHVRQFADKLPKPRTQKEQIAERLISGMRISKGRPASKERER